MQLRWFSLRNRLACCYKHIKRGPASSVMTVDLFKYNPRRYGRWCFVTKPRKTLTKGEQDIVIGILNNRSELSQSLQVNKVKENRYYCLPSTVSAVDLNTFIDVDSHNIRSHADAWKVGRGISQPASSPSSPRQGQKHCIQCYMHVPSTSKSDTSLPCRAKTSTKGNEDFGQTTMKRRPITPRHAATQSRPLSPQHFKNFHPQLAPLHPIGCKARREVLFRISKKTLSNRYQLDDNDNDDMKDPNDVESEFISIQPLEKSTIKVYLPRTDSDEHHQ